MHSLISFISRISILIALFVIVIVGFSGSAQAQPQRRGIPAPKETFLPDHNVEIEMLRFRQLPMIELMLNDSGPYRMIVDTGAAGLVVTPKLAEKLDLPSPPGMPAGMQVQVKTPGGPVPAILKYVDKIDIGDASFKGVWTIATSLPFGDGMDGIIGMNVFKEGLLTYEYPNNRVLIGRGELPEPNGTDVLAYTTPRMPDSHPVIEFSIDGQQKQALVDTGMRGWFAIPGKEIENFKALQGPVVAGMGMSVGKPKPGKAARIQGLFKIGDNRVKDPIVRLMDDDFMVGTLFLENFAVTFDGKNKRVRMTPAGDDPLVQPALISLGFELKRHREKMVVWHVHPDSDAAAKGLKIDDVVLELNGKSAKNAYDSKELLNTMQTESSIPVVYQREISGKSKTLDIKLMEIISASEQNKANSIRNRPEVDAKTIKLGKAAFEQGMCAKCHGQDGAGSKRGPNLTDSQWDHCDGSAEGIRQILLSGIAKTELKNKNHRFAMNPATNLIKDKSAITALAQYVFSLKDD